MARYRYIGPCRCGLGPHAFYEDTETGEIKHAWQILSESGLPVPAWPGGGWGRGWRGGPGWGGGWWWALASADEETRKEMIEAMRKAFGEDLAKAMESFVESLKSSSEVSKDELKELREKLEELEKKLKELSGEE